MSFMHSFSGPTGKYFDGGSLEIMPHRNLETRYSFADDKIVTTQRSDSKNMLHNWIENFATDRRLSGILMDTRDEFAIATMYFMADCVIDAVEKYNCDRYKINDIGKLISMDIIPLYTMAKVYGLVEKTSVGIDVKERLLPMRLFFIEKDPIADDLIKDSDGAGYKITDGLDISVKSYYEPTPIFYHELHSKCMSSFGAICVDLTKKQIFLKHSIIEAADTDPEVLKSKYYDPFKVSPPLSLAIYTSSFSNISD